MPLDYRIEHCNGVIEVRVAGIPDRDSIAEMWSDIVAACARHECLYILGISRVDQPQRVADAIDHQAIFLEAGVTTEHRIAWVQLNPDAVEVTRLAETVLLNRGIASGRTFTDAVEARRWLRGDP